MISSVQEALSTPAELVCVVLSLLGLLASQRYMRLSWATTAAMMVWSTLSALYREQSGVLGTKDLPVDEWAGLLASQHGYAMRVAFVGATGGALVVGATTVLRDGDRRVSQIFLGAALIWAAAAFGSPPVGLAALILLGLSLGAVRRGGVEVAVAGWLVSMAALFGAESALYRSVALFHPGDLEAIDARALGRMVAAAGALPVLLASGRMVWTLRSRGGGLALASLSLLAVLLGLAAARTLARGPVHTLSDRLPVQKPAVPARVVKGCVVSAEGSVTAVGSASCPAHKSSVFFSGPPDAPSAVLLGLHEGGGGDVGVLARMDEGWALRDWRVTAVPVVVRATPPTDPALQLLPDPIVAVLREGRWTDAAGRPLGEALAARMARTPRLDVVFPLAAVPTVGALLSACDPVLGAGPGVRCVLGGGPVEGYRASTPQPTAPIEIEFEVIESPEG